MKHRNSGLSFSYLQAHSPSRLTKESILTLDRGYLNHHETPLMMNGRLAARCVEDYPTGYKQFSQEELYNQLLNAFNNCWISPASPVAANYGSDSGFPVSCLVSGTKIHTKNGFKLIEDLTVGDEVLTHLGRYKAVTAITNRKSTDDLYELTLKGRSQDPLKITGNHPVLTQRGWVRVDELRDKDKIFREPITHLFRKNGTNKKICFDVQSKNANKIKTDSQFKCSVLNRVKLDCADFLWFLGLWIAEGHTANRTFGITMGTHEYHIVQKWLSIGEKILGIKGSLTYQTNENNGNSWLNGRFNSIIFVNWLEKEFGKNCKEKTIPEYIFNCKDENLNQFLDAVLLGDGTKEKISRLRLVNPELIYQLFYIASILGRAGSLGKEKISYYEDDVFVASLTVYPRQIKSYPVYYELEKLDHNELVWDLTVAEDHSFLAQGIVVHNCFGVEVDNTMDDIGLVNHEIMMLTKQGGGIGLDLSNLIGQSKVVAWAKLFDTAISKCSQKGSGRRGSIAQYISVWHPDFDLIMEAKDLLKGDSKQKLECNIAVKVDRKFRELLKAGDAWALNRFHKILETRMKFGSPYIFFADNVLDADPPWYKDKGLKTVMSQLCAEITLATIPRQVTFSCVLSSVNALYYPEWKQLDDQGLISLPELGIIFLDAVNDDFVQLAKNYKYPRGFEKAARGAELGGPLGLGLYGLGALFMSKMMPFTSLEARHLNVEVFKYLRDKAELATAELANIKGEREWTKGWGRRNTHLIAIAPTTTSSLIGGGVTPGIQPIMGNVFSKSGAKGTFKRRNPFLEELLNTYGKNTPEVWSKIARDMGSVKNLDFLSEREREVFRTFYEISPVPLTEMAIDRQQFIDQGQSFNYAVSPHIDAQEYMDAHLLAWDGGLKTLYYTYSESEMNDVTDFDEMAIFLRTRENCIYCKKAKALLHDFGLEWVEEEKPTGKVPEIWINGEMLENGYESLVHYLEGEPDDIPALNTEDAPEISLSISECMGCDQ